MRDEDKTLGVVQSARRPANAVGGIFANHFIPCSERGRRRRPLASGFRRPRLQNIAAIVLRLGSFDVEPRAALGVSDVRTPRSVAYPTRSNRSGRFNGSPPVMTNTGTRISAI